MSDERDKIVRIVRGSKVGIDDRGRILWLDPVKEVELERVRPNLPTERTICRQTMAGSIRTIPAD